MANKVIGDPKLEIDYMAIDAKMSDIKRQLRNPNGNKIDTHMLSLVLQFFADGQSMYDYIACFPNKFSVPGTRRATIDDADHVFPSTARYQPISALRLPERFLERLSRPNPIGTLRDINDLTDGGYSREEVQEFSGLNDRDMQLIDECLAARGLRMKTEAEIRALLH